MAKKIRDISRTQERIDHKVVGEAMGAKEIGITIDTNKGPISLFTLRQFLVERLRSSGGRPTLKGSSKKRNKIPLLEDDWHKLKAIADYCKEKDGITVSPGQVASAIIHSMVAKMDIGLKKDRVSSIS